MAIQFADGFDHYASAANLAVMYPTMVQTNWTCPNTGTPFGRGRFAAHAQGVLSVGLPRDLPNPIPLGQPFGFSCNIQVTTYPAAFDRMGLVQFNEGATNHCEVRIGSDGSLYPCRNGSYLSTTTNRQLVLNQWYHFECRAIVHDTLGEFEIKINGETWYIINPTITGGNVDTRSAATGVINAVRMLPKFSSTTPGAINIDNAVFWDGTGTRNNSWLGEVEVFTINPSANGTVTGWTPNTGQAYAAIDDGPSGSDGDTTYIASSAVNDVADFVLDDLPVTPDAILAVQSFIIGRKTDSGTRGLKHGVDSNGNIAESAEVMLGTTYQGYTFVVEVDPDTGLPFTPSAINALKSRVKTQS